MGNKRKSWSEAEMLELIACKRKKVSNMKTWDMCLAKGVDCTYDDLVQQWKDVLHQFRLIYTWETNRNETISFFDMDVRTRRDNGLPMRMDKAVYHELVRFQGDMIRPNTQHSAKRRRRRARAAPEENESDSGAESLKSDVQQDAEGQLKLARGKRSLCALNQAVVEADRTSAESGKLRGSSSATGEAEPNGGQKVVEEAEDDVTGPSAIDEVELPSLSSQLVADLELVDKQDPYIEKAAEVDHQEADSKPWIVDDSQALVILKMEDPTPTSSQVSRLPFQDMGFLPLPEPLTVVDEEFDGDAFADAFLTLHEEEATPSTSKTPERMPDALSSSWRTQRKLEIERQKSELLMRANLTFVMAMSQLSAAVHQLSQKLC